MSHPSDRADTGWTDISRRSFIKRAGQTGRGPVDPRPARACGTTAPVGPAPSGSDPRRAAPPRARPGRSAAGSPRQSGDLPIYAGQQGDPRPACSPRRAAPALQLDRVHQPGRHQELLRRSTTSASRSAPSTRSTRPSQSSTRAPSSSTCSSPSSSTSSSSSSARSCSR